MNIHRHFSFHKVPLIQRGLWSSKVYSSFKVSLAQGRGGDSSSTGPGFAGSSLCLAEAPVKRDIIKTRFELFQHKILSLLPALTPLFPWTTAAPTQLLELCGALGWAASACSGQRQNQLITRESCQHRRQSANIQTVFLMTFFFFFGCHERRMKHLKPPWSTVYLTLGSAAMLEMLKLQVGRLPFCECKMTFWLLLTTSQIVLALLLLQFESLQCILSKNHLGATEMVTFFGRKKQPVTKKVSLTSSGGTGSRASVRHWKCLP